MGRKKNEWIRLTARVTLADYLRLKDIQEKYKVSIQQTPYCENC